MNGAEGKGCSWDQPEEDTERTQDALWDNYQVPWKVSVSNDFIPTATFYPSKNILLWETLTCFVQFVLHLTKKTHKIYQIWIIFGKSFNNIVY